MNLSVKDKKFYVIVFFTILIMYGFGFLPTFGQITPEGMRVLGIFLGCIFAWCFGEIVWSSILGLVSLVILGFGTMAGNFSSAYGNYTIATMLAAITFCYAIEKSGLLAEISRWIVGQKWAQKSPWGLVLAFYIAATVLGAVATNVLPALILLWALFYEMAKEVNIKPYEPIAVIILCGIGVTGFMGVAMMPYNAMAALIRGVAEKADPNFVYHIEEYLLLNFMTAVIYIPVVVFVLRLFVGKKVNFVMPQCERYKINLNSESRISLMLLILVILSMVVPNFLPAENPIRLLFVNKLTVVGTFMLGAVILMLIHVHEKPILDIAEGVANIPWSLILLVSSALAISDFLTADGMGIVPTIVTALNPLMEGKSPLAIMLLFVVIGLVMTNFINDMVTCIVLCPIAIQFILDAGGSVMLFTILFSQVAIQGCLMPSGSATGAMFHGNSAWMKSKDIFFYVTIMEIVLLLVLLGVSLFGNMLGI